MRGSDSLTYVVARIPAAVLKANLDEREPNRSTQEDEMALFMDIHQKVEGLTADAVAEAHRKDVEIQHDFGVDYRQYWFDEESGMVFCLVEAPDAEAASRVHREAHGLVADQLIPVQEGVIPVTAD